MRTKLFLLAVLCLVAILTRTVFRIGPNIELVTAVSIAAGFILRSGYALLVPLIVLGVSDIILGNSMIFIFTWSAYLLAPIFSKLLIHFKGKKLTVMAATSGVIFTFFFYVWTNLGVVIVSEMYSKDVFGLMQSYLNGLPFLMNQLLGNIIFTPVVILICSSVLELRKSSFALSTDPAAA